MTHIPATLRLGTRGSCLALWQAEWVASQLRAQHRDITVELVIIKTSGEKLPDVQLQQVGGKDLFTAEIEAALLEGSIDLAVHSLKDLPTELPQGLEIGAYCKREEPRDVLICTSGSTLDELPRNAHIGTSSLRRTAQILSIRPDITCEAIRGNIDTRLRKLKESQELSGIVLAAAGLIRMGWQDLITQYLDEDLFLPAPGQGVVAVELCTEQREVHELVASINHKPSEYEARAERTFLSVLEGGCQVPVGARAKYAKGSLDIKGMVATLDGSRVVRAQTSGADPDLVGAETAALVLQRGADEILSDMSMSKGGGFR